MKEFSPNSFFDLNKYEHGDLFTGASFVWEALGRLKPYLLDRKRCAILSPIPDGVHLINKETIFIDKDCIIEPGSYIQGPCWIGRGSEIRHGAYIRGFVITGSKCVIGHTTEVKHSILLDRVHAAHFNYVGDSILGNDVNLGAGVKLANLRLDRKEIKVRFGEEFFKTGLMKFGAVLGDQTEIGCNAVTNPGTMAPPRFLCLPCQNVSGYLHKKQRVLL